MKRRIAPSRLKIAASLLLLFASGTATYSQPKPPAGSAPPGAESAPPGMPGGPPPRSPQSPSTTVTIQVPINSEMSLVHVGSSDSFAITTEGRQAATLLLEALEEPAEATAKEKASKASKIYENIIPRENYGGEYSALQWFADYVVADSAGKVDFLRDPQVAFFFNVYGGDDFAVLKEYLARKYRLRELADEETKTGLDRKIWLEDTILFENPRRESWEKTSELLKLLKIKPGDRVADVGSGPGYYSFQFAKMVGPSGQIFSVEMNAEHLKYVEAAKDAMGVTNVTTVETDGKSVGLAGIQTKVDAIFLCSLYHNMYAMATQPERDSFVSSIKESLTDDGTLYLVDNGLVPPGILPYHGPYVAKELIIAQMLNYGFDLIEQHQYIPQRYLLTFKVRKAEVTPQAGVTPKADAPKAQTKAKSKSKPNTKSAKAKTRKSRSSDVR
jgi:SAM-dependent methyltransferase